MIQMMKLVKTIVMLLEGALETAGYKLVCGLEYHLQVPLATHTVRPQQYALLGVPSVQGVTPPVIMFVARMVNGKHIY